MADDKATSQTCALCPRHEKEINRLRGHVGEYRSRQEAMLQRINELGHQILNRQTRNQYEELVRKLRCALLRERANWLDGAGTYTVHQRLMARARRLRAKADRIERGAP